MNLRGRIASSSQSVQIRSRAREQRSVPTLRRRRVGGVDAAEIDAQRAAMGRKMLDIKHL